jgi:hypothetical protein
MERGESEADDRQNSASTDVFVFFLNLPHAPTPKKITFYAPLSLAFCFWAWAGMGLGGYCSVVPPQLGAESDRAPCSAPVVCACFVSLPKTSLALPSQCRLSRKHQRNPKFLPVLAGPGAYACWSAPRTPARFFSSLCPPCPPTLSHVS